MATVAEQVDLLQQNRLPSVNRNLGVVFGANIANLVLGQVFNLLLFYFLAPTDVGLINWGTAAAGIVFYVSDLGIDSSLVVALKQRPVSIGGTTAFVGAVRFAVAAIALTIWAMSRGLGWFGPSQSSVLLIVGLALVVRSLATPFVAHLQVRNKQPLVAVIQVVPVVLRVFGVLALWFLHELGVTSALLAWLAAELVGLLCMAIAARLERETGTTGDVRGLVHQVARSAPPIALSQLLLAGQNRADWLIVAALTSYVGLANYAIANKALELLILAGSVFGRNALPWFVDGWGSRNLTTSVRLLSSGLVAAGLVLGVWGASILQFVFGSKYTGADSVIPVLAALAPALGAYQLAQFASFGRGRSSYAVISGGVGLAAQIVVDLMLVPKLGILGAAYGMCAYAGLALPIQLWLGRRDVVPTRTAIELLAAGAVLPAALIVAWLTGLSAHLTAF